MVAQGALNQIVGQVFSRVRPDLKLATRGTVPSVPTSPRPSASRTASQTNFSSRLNEGDVSIDSSSVPGNASDQEAEKKAEVQEVQAELQDLARKRSRTSVETIRPAAPEAIATEQDTASEAQQVNSAVPEVVEPAAEPVEQTEDGVVDEASANDGKQRPTKLTLANLESEAAASGVDLPGQGGDSMRTPAPDTPQTFYSLNELHTKDAYLVFRALCKLGMKPLGVER